MLVNLHTHTHFSDGSSLPEDYVEEAIRQGFHTLGFSDHSPVPFENTFAIREERLSEYITVIQTLQAKYSHSVQLNPTPDETIVKVTKTPQRRKDAKINMLISNSLQLSALAVKEKNDMVQSPRERTGLSILLGLEIDYIPGITKPVDEYRQMNCFDYFIGSVHLVRNGDSSGLWFIDGPDINIYDEGLKSVFGNDIKKAVTAYYHQINGMIDTQRPDILGHFDKIRMYNRNRYFLEDDKWYRDLIDETLGLVKESKTIVEVNTRGIYKKRSDALFPGIEILKKIKSLDIPVIISSDAHRPEELSFGFDETRRLLTGLGFENLSMKSAGDWIEVPLV